MLDQKTKIVKRAGTKKTNKLDKQTFFKPNFPIFKIEYCNPFISVPFPFFIFYQAIYFPAI